MKIEFDLNYNELDLLLDALKRLLVMWGPHTVEDIDNLIKKIQNVIKERRSEDENRVGSS